MKPKSASRRNPLDLTDQKIDLLADAGVNRISLGVQSFSQDALLLLERDHTSNQIEDVVHRLRRRFDNISLDLIFAVPGQSLQDWRQTLRPGDRTWSLPHVDLRIDVGNRHGVWPAA